MKAHTKITPWLNLCAGIVWIWVALRHFDRLSLLDGYHFPENRGIVPHRGGSILLPCVTGLLFLVAAVLGFLRRNSNSKDGAPPVITLFGPPPR